MKKLTGLQENQILEIAALLESKGNVWVNTFKEDKDYILNNNPILEIFMGEQCSVHSSKNLECVKMRIPFLWKWKENRSLINLTIGYCKYCRKFFLPVKCYEKYKEKGEFLCKLSRENIIINDLTEQDIKDWEETTSEQKFASLYSITKNDAKYLLNVEKKRALVPIVSENGDLHYEDVPIYYSKNTRCCYIYTETINRLKIKGVILCRLVKANNIDEPISDFNGLNTESLIHQYGYNVSAIDDLSIQQRRQILVNILNQGVISIEKVKNHLAFLINVNKAVDKMQSACEKWREDFCYLDNLEQGMFELTNVTEVIVKNVMVSNS